MISAEKLPGVGWEVGEEGQGKPERLFERVLKSAFERARSCTELT